jgi:hypothetical protein
MKHLGEKEVFFTSDVRLCFSVTSLSPLGYFLNLVEELKEVM